MNHYKIIFFIITFFVIGYLYLKKPMIERLPDKKSLYYKTFFERGFIYNKKDHNTLFNPNLRIKRNTTTTKKI